MRKAGQKGFTLVELAVGMALLTLLLPPLGTVVYQLLRTPAHAQAVLQGQEELRRIGRWLNLDGTRAQSFVLGSDPDYGTFGWRDYTEGIPVLYQVRYYYQNGSLMREEAMDGMASPAITVTSALGSYSDVTFRACTTLVTVAVTPTVEWWGGGVSIPGQSYYLRLRTEPWGELTQQSLGYALFAIGNGAYPDQAIDWPGDGYSIVGNVHSNGDVYMNGSSNEVTDAVTVSGNIMVVGGGNTFGPSQSGVAPRPAPTNCSLADFPAPTFSWTGDVNLEDIAEVWEDYPTRKRLKPGIYITTGAMSLGLDRNNVAGAVTFVAGQISVDNANGALTPYYAGITAFATGSGPRAITIEGQNAIWRGMLYAPNGEVYITSNSDDLTLYGSIVAQKIRLGDNDVRIVHDAY